MSAGASTSAGESAVGRRGRGVWRFECGFVCCQRSLLISHPTRPLPTSPPPCHRRPPPPTPLTPPTHPSDPLQRADALDFDPEDVTKTWPEDLFPLQPVGRMVLNRNPDNFFNENEQLAFCPALVVPGVHYSNDKLLQTRIFSYQDTQRHRLGGNYLLLPVNAPKNAHHNNHHDGFMNFVQRTEEVGGRGRGAVGVGAGIHRCFALVPEQSASRHPPCVSAGELLPQPLRPGAPRRALPHRVPPPQRPPRAQ